MMAQSLLVLRVLLFSAQLFEVNTYGKLQSRELFQPKTRGETVIRTHCLTDKLSVPNNLNADSLTIYLRQRLNRKVTDLYDGMKKAMKPADMHTVFELGNRNLLIGVIVTIIASAYLRRKGIASNRASEQVCSPSRWQSDEAKCFRHFRREPTRTRIVKTKIRGANQLAFRAN
ncbi:hypothetical protein CSKR_111489 [Clonorchis sinensis]|uniref:Uncharacterized protein n=1 Tax=Clonorchis sinensis TaxID=79923 RepID=A0A419Q5D5_CLOSI|nr:hypothetical protein CSKR_111489 [Clonorchis sinensis]